MAHKTLFQNKGLWHCIYTCVLVTRTYQDTLFAMQTCAVDPSPCGADLASTATSQDVQHGPIALKQADGSTDVVDANTVEVEAVIVSGTGADLASPATSQDVQHRPIALKQADGSTDVVDANADEVETVIVSGSGGPLVVPHATGAISHNKDMELVSDNSAEPSEMKGDIAGDSMVVVEAILDTALQSPLETVLAETIPSNSLETTENRALETTPNTSQQTTDNMSTQTTEDTDNVVNNKTRKTPDGKSDKDVADPGPIDVVVWSTTTKSACDPLEQVGGMEGALDVVDAGLGITVHGESTATAEAVSEEHVYKKNKRTNPDTVEKIDKRHKKTTTQKDGEDS